MLIYINFTTQNIDEKSKRNLLAIARNEFLIALKKIEPTLSGLKIRSNYILYGIEVTGVSRETIVKGIKKMNMRTDLREIESIMMDKIKGQEA